MCFTSSASTEDFAVERTGESGTVIHARRQQPAVAKNEDAAAPPYPKPKRTGGGGACSPEGAGVTQRKGAPCAEFVDQKTIILYCNNRARLIHMSVFIHLSVLKLIVLF